MTIYNGILKHAGRLYRKRRAAQSGLLVRLSSPLGDGERRLKKLAAALEGIRKAASELDGPALELCGGDSSSGGGVFRFSPERNNDGAEKSLFPLLASLGKKLRAFTELARKLIEQFPDTDEGPDPFARSAVWELNAVLRRFDDIAGICASFTEYRQRPGEVMFIERRGDGAGKTGGKAAGTKGAAGWAAFTQSPVELAESLRESLFSPNKTVVCVSATLAINGNFNFWAVRTGAALTEKSFFTDCFPSPFPYSEAVLLAVPRASLRSLSFGPKRTAGLIRRALQILKTVYNWGFLLLFLYN